MKGDASDICISAYRLLLTPRFLLVVWNIVPERRKLQGGVASIWHSTLSPISCALSEETLPTTELAQNVFAYETFPLLLAA